MKIFLIHRQNILKEKRQEMYSDAVQRKMEHDRKQEWIQNILTQQMIKHIYTIFDQRREVVVR